MTKQEAEHMEFQRWHLIEFGWVATSRSTAPGQTDHYEHPFTNGAWETWKRFKRMGQTDGGADVPLDRLVMPEMVLIPIDKYFADKSDFQMRGTFIKAVKKIVDEDSPNWKERISDWLKLLT